MFVFIERHSGNIIFMEDNTSKHRDDKSLHSCFFFSNNVTYIYMYSQNPKQ